MSLVIIFCLLLGWIGISTAYKNTLRLGWGQEKKAIEILEGAGASAILVDENLNITTVGEIEFEQQ